MHNIPTERRADGAAYYSLLGGNESSMFYPSPALLLFSRCRRWMGDIEIIMEPAAVVGEIRFHELVDIAVCFYFQPIDFLVLTDFAF